MMSAFAVLSLLLEEFWDSLTTDEQAQLVKIYDSPNPEEYKNDPIAVHLMQWFTANKNKKFIQNLEQLQQFITAERKFINNEADDKPICSNCT